jgi:hypothetical protein
VSVRPRTVVLALAPGLVALLLAVVALTSFAHTPSGTLCSGRVYRAAWQPETLVFSGERPAGEADRLRAECQAGAETTVRNARRAAVVGIGLLAVAGASLGLAEKRTGRRR